MIRYVFAKDQHYIWKDPEFVEKIFVPDDREGKNRYVNILSVEPYSSSKRFKIRIYYASGEILEGYTLEAIAPLILENFHEVFDGRFNV